MNGKVNLKLLEQDKKGNYKNIAQNIETNIQKFKNIAPEAVKDLETVSNIGFNEMKDGTYEVIPK